MPRSMFSEDDVPFVTVEKGRVVYPEEEKDFTAYISSPQHYQELLARLKNETTRNQCLSELSPLALILLRLFAEIQEYVPLPYAQGEAETLLGEYAGLAFRELQQESLLLVTLRYGELCVGVISEIAELLLSALPLIHHPVPLISSAASNADEQSLPPAILQRPVEMALFAAALWTLRPRATTGGYFYKKDEEKVRDVLGADFPLARVVAELVSFGVLRRWDGFTLEDEVLLRVISMSPAEYGRLALHSELPLALHPVLARLYEYQGKWVPLSFVAHFIRILELKQPLYHRGYTAFYDASLGAAKRLLQLPGIQYAKEGEQEFVRVAPGLLAPAEQPPASDAARLQRIHVQPSFEVLLPKDTPAKTVFLLAKICDLVRVDQMTMMKLSQASIQRATEGGMDTQAILAILSENAHAGVPQNVAVQIQSWAGELGVARFIEGLLVKFHPSLEPRVAMDPQLAPLLRRKVDEGLFLIAQRDRITFEKRLKGLHIQVSPSIWKVDQSPAPNPARDPLHVAVIPGSLPRSMDPRLIAAVAKGVRQLRRNLSDEPLLAKEPFALCARKVAKPAKAPAVPKPPEKLPEIWPEAPIPPQAPRVLRRGEAFDNQSKQNQQAKSPDPMPENLPWMVIPPESMELFFQRCIRSGATLFVHLSTGEGPWALRPQQISHRGKQVCLEAYRPSISEFRSIPFSMIVSIATLEKT